MLGQLSMVYDCNCHRRFTILKESLQRSNVCTHFITINSIHITQQRLIDISSQTALADQAHMHVFVMICPLTLKGS